MIVLVFENVHFLFLDKIETSIVSASDLYPGCVLPCMSVEVMLVRDRTMIGLVTGTKRKGSLMVINVLVSNGSLEHVTIRNDARFHVLV